jgi:progressive ankylosis protein
MAIESPISVGIISRLQDAEVQTAAFFIVGSLSLWIESPVIDLLATSTTLARSSASYWLLRRYTLLVIAWVTALHALVSATPLYWIVTLGILRIPQEVAEAAQPALIVMIPWSGFIGWRRFQQGVLIRYGYTRAVGVGTGIRMAAMLAVGIGLYLYSDLSGVVIASVALVASVVVEAIFVHAVSIPVIRERLLMAPAEEPKESKAGGRPEMAEPESMGPLFRFHMPLAVTTMVTLLTGPIVSAALARAPMSVLALASWQVAASLLFMHRTIVFALPEVVITLYRDAASRAMLRRFCIGVGLFSSGFLLVMAFSGGASWFFVHALGVDVADRLQMAWLAFLAGFLMPLLGAMQSYVRGMLTAHHLTMARLVAIVVALTVLIAMLWIGVWRGWTGVINAAAAMTVAMVAELAALVWLWRKGSRGDA